jgi:TrmH family RNA methyltransferase
MKLTNNQVKLYSSLKHKKYRRQHGLFIADGPHLVMEALKSDWQPAKVVITHEAMDLAFKLEVPKNSLAIAASRQFGQISPSRTPQGILAIVKSIDSSDLRPRIIRDAISLIACDNISDPGNLGAIIRTAAAFSYDAVILIGNCAEIYNPKVVRATQGALFKIPIIERVSSSRFIKDFVGIFDTVVLSNKAKKSLSSVPVLNRPLIVVGGETTGIDPQIEASAQYLLKIEQSDKVESLNAAIAAGVAMYKFSAR